MKRKAEAEPEEQPKEKKQDTLVKFKRPVAYVFRVWQDAETFKSRWQWLSEFGWKHTGPNSGPGRNAMKTLAYANVNWSFAPEIEPLVFKFFFGDTLRGLSKIIAEYAEVSFAGCSIAFHIGSAPCSQMCEIGEPWPGLDAADILKEIQNSRPHVERWPRYDCSEGCVAVDIPYPTTENVI
jgi:hypothetical protein